MGKVKNQHLVPKCYLKNFTTSDGKDAIWLFDKKLNKEASSNIKDIATSRYFYDIPPDYLKKGADEQGLEKILSTLEGEFNSCWRFPQKTRKFAI